MLNDDDALRKALRASRSSSFGAGFAARVMRRTADLQRTSVTATIQRYFLWLAPAAIAAIAVLMVHNARVSGHTSIDGLLALPPVTLDVAYSYETGAVHR